MAINSSVMTLSQEDMAQAIKSWLERDALYARDQDFEIKFETTGRAIVTFTGQKLKESATA